MREFWQFVSSVLRQWAILASGAALTIILGVVEHVRQAPVSWRTYYSLLSLVVFAACFIAWRDEHNRAEAAKNESEALKKKYFDESPRIGLTVVNAAYGEKGWQEAASSKNVPVFFSMQYLSGRIATSVRFDPVLSISGKFSLRFDALPHIDGPGRKALTYEVWEDCMPPVPGVLERIGRGYDLLLFLSDIPMEVGEVEYRLTARFKDRGEEREQSFRLVFDRVKFSFLQDTNPI